MKRTELLQEVRKMRFEEAYEGWERGRLTQEEAALLLGVCDRTFRRYLVRYEEKGMEGLIDQRLGQVSHRCAPVDEVMALSSVPRVFGQALLQLVSTSPWRDEELHLGKEQAAGARVGFQGTPQRSSSKASSSCPLCWHDASPGRFPA